MDNIGKKVKEMIKKFSPILKKLRNQNNLDDLFDMSFALRKGHGRQTVHKELIKKFNLENCDSIVGAYIFFDAKKPIYTGISRNIAKRFIDHVKGDTHFSASLAYRVACKKLGIKLGENRNNIMSQDNFKSEFENAKK